MRLVKRDVVRGLRSPLRPNFAVSEAAFCVLCAADLHTSKLRLGLQLHVRASPRNTEMLTCGMLQVPVILIARARQWQTDDKYYCKCFCGCHNGRWTLGTQHGWLSVWRTDSQALVNATSD